MAKCFVIGGGLAGLSSAVHLSEKGHQVEIIEASPKLGGRTYSFFDQHTNSEIDNGQHILMGSYKNTFEFLKIIDSENKPVYQKKINVDFLKKGGSAYSLKAPHNFYPLNLIQSLLGFNAIDLKEKIFVLKMLSSIFLKKYKNIEHKSILTFLTKEKQSQNTISSLWEIISIGALNTKLDEATASVFHSLIVGMFFNGNKSSTIVLPKLPLNKLFIEPAEKYFDYKNIKYSCSERLISLTISGNKVTEIITNKRKVTGFDQLIIAIPPYSINQIKSETQILPKEILEMETSPIITIHFWLKEKFFNKDFIGLIDSKIHWLFNNDDHLSIVISAADELIKKDSLEIYDIICEELSKYFPEFTPREIISYKVIKEKRATLKCNFKNEQLRKSIKSNLVNTSFAGDWVNTHLPGTIEGAILSGKQAANKINY